MAPAGLRRGTGAAAGQRGGTASQGTGLDGAAAAAGKPLAAAAIRLLAPVSARAARNLSRLALRASGSHPVRVRLRVCECVGGGCSLDPGPSGMRPCHGCSPHPGAECADQGPDGSHTGAVQGRRRGARGQGCLLKMGGKVAVEQRAGVLGEFL